MSNRFDQPIKQDFQDLRTYVPMPLNMIAGLAKEYGDNYHKGLESIDNTESLLKINAIDQHRDAANKLINEQHAKLSTLADALMKDPTNYSNQRAINKFKQEWINNPYRLEMEYSKQLWDEDTKKMRELKSDPYWRNTMENFQGIDEKGNIQPYRSGRIYDVLDYNKAAKDWVGKINASGTYWDTTELGTDGIIRGKKGEHEFIMKDKLNEIADGKADSFMQSAEGRELISKLAYDYRSNTDKDPSYNQLREYTKQFLYDAASEQLFDKFKGSKVLDVTRMWEHNKKEEDIKKQFGLLGTFEGDVTLKNITKGDALTNLGIRHSNENGDINYSLLKDSPDNVKKQFENIKNKYSKGEITTDSYLRELNNLGIMNKNSVENQRKANEYYSDLLTTAKSLYNQYDEDGKTNLFDKQFKDSKTGKYKFEDMKNYLIDYYSNVEKNASVTHNFQADLRKNITENYFGEYDTKNNKFKIAPSVAKMLIYEQNNPKTKDNINEEFKNNIAKTGSFIGLDFNAPDLGAMTVMATNPNSSNNESKTYTVIPNDPVIKNLMGNIWNFSQKFKKASLNKLDKETLQKDKTDGLTALLDIANTINNSDDDLNIKSNKINLLNQLQSAFRNSGKQTVFDVSSDRSKMYFTVQKINPRTNAPDQTVFEVDHNGNISEKTLGEIQHEESAKIQMLIAPGFNKNAEGFDPNKVSY